MRKRGRVDEKEKVIGNCCPGKYPSGQTARYRKKIGDKRQKGRRGTLVHCV